MSKEEIETQIQKLQAQLAAEPTALEGEPGKLIEKQSKEKPEPTIAELAGSIKSLEASFRDFHGSVQKLLAWDRSGFENEFASIKRRLVKLEGAIGVTFSKVSSEDVAAVDDRTTPYDLSGLARDQEKR